MNWPFWSLSRPAHSESCESIEPLLSLYVDGMASPEERRRIEAHLPDCESCREALSWIQATHRALAARPVVAPPPDLHSRIALAIAASSATPISLRPARTFKLRPAYAAAASVTAIGLVLSYSLLHVPGEMPAKHAPKSQSTASLPAPTAKSSPASLPRLLRVKPGHPLVASAAPHAVRPNTGKHTLVLKKTAPVDVPAPQDYVASAVPPPAAPPTSARHLLPAVPPLPLKAPAHNMPPHTLMASHKIAPVETRLPTIHMEPSTPKSSAPPLIASRMPELPTVRVQIGPATVTEHASVQTASTGTPPSSKLADILGPEVKSYVKQMSSAGYLRTGLTTRQSSFGAANAMQAFGRDHIAYLDAIHPPPP